MKKLDFLVTLTSDIREQNNVTIAFTMALNAKKRGLETDVLILSYATYLMEVGYAEMVDICVPFMPVKKLIDE